MRITNIKISCHISSTEKVEDLIPQSHVLTYYSGVGRFVIKSDTFTFTLMEKLEAPSILLELKIFVRCTNQLSHLKDVFHKFSSLSPTSK